MSDVNLWSTESPTCHVVDVGSIRLVFSYQTCVAFYSKRTGWACSQNIWSRTTGKHLNQMVPDRTEVEESWPVFQKHLAAVLENVAVLS